MEEHLWRGNHGGEIIEGRSWRRHYIEKLAEGIWGQEHPGDTQEVFRKHAGGTRAISRTSQRKRPGDTKS